MSTEVDKILNKLSTTWEIHFILSHSYIVYLFAVIFGVVFDLIFPLEIFINGGYKYTGLWLIILGSLVVYWAQSTSVRIRKTKTQKGEHPDFHYGPYKYLRSPTHFGLFIMILGLAVIIESPFSILFAFFAQIIIKVFFLRKKEKLLKEKYREAYIKHKGNTKNHI